jgi:hypothetical protein
VKTLSNLFLTLSIIAFVPTASAQAKNGAGNTSSPSSATPPAASQPSPSTAAFESQMLAYGGIDHIAKALAARVCSLDDVNQDNVTIVVYDQTAFASLQSYQAFVANLRIVSSAYQMLIPKDSLATVLEHLRTIFGNRSSDYNAMATHDQSQDQKKNDQHSAERWKEMSISLTADPFSDAVSLLSAIAISSNVETPGQVTIPDSAMAVVLTRELKARCKKAGLTIVYPPLFGRGSSSDFASADIQAYLQKLDDIRVQAQEYVEGANADFASNYSPQKTVTKQTTTGKASEKGSAIQDTTVSQTGSNSITGDPVLTAELGDINGLYDNFMNSLLQINSSTGVIGSASVIQGYQLATLLKGVQNDDSTWKQTPAFVLLASVINAGGTELDHKTIWTALWSGDKITYSGGAIVNVSLWRADSALPIYVDVLRYRVPFSELNDPGNVDGVDAGDNLKEKP